MGCMVEQESVLISEGWRRSSAWLFLAGLFTVALAPVACDDSVTIPNAAPSLAGVDAITCAEGVCELWLRVVDPDLDGVDLLIECLLDGDQACVLEDAPGTDGRFGLVPDRSPPGREHLLRLVPVLDDEGATLRLRITPTDMRGEGGTPFTTPGFTMSEGL